MAKLPSEADLIGRGPNLPVERGSVTAARPSGLDVAARGMQALAHGVAGLGEGVATASLREKDRFDDMAVEDAFNQLRQKQLDLTYGKDDGFANKKGGDAVKANLLADYGQKFTDATTGVAETLTDDRQKERFRKRADIAGATFKADIMRHVSQEANRYAEGTFRSTIDVETRQATANWDSPAAIALSTERIQNAVKLEADRLGYGPDDPQRQALQMHAVSSVHAAVITQALQNNDAAYAEQYYGATKDSLDPAVVKVLGHQVADGVQKSLATSYQTTFIANRDDIRGLGTLEQTVSADAKLGEDRKNILLGRIESRRDLLAMRAIHEEDQRVRRVQTQISQVEKLTLAGYEPTADTMLALTNAAKGTQLEGQVREMVASANVTKQFRLATPQQQEATITALETAAHKDPSKFDVNVIDRFKKLYANQQQETKNDPVTFALRQGLVKEDDAAAQPVDFTNPATLGDQLSARFNLARAVAARYQAPVKPLTREEADALGGMLKTAPVDKKGQIFSMLTTASGGDFDGYKAMLAQVAPDDPVTAHAGIMAGRGRMSTDAGFKPDPGQATSVANLILQGQAVLRPNRKEDGQPEKGKLWPMPKDEDMAKTFQSTERDAFAGRPEARNGFYQTAKSIYAARTVEAGDASGVLDSGRWDEAIKLATGGIERWNGKSIVMPWGMSRGQFKDELQRRIDDVVESGALPKGVTGGKLYDMPIEAVGDGRYMFRAGDGLLVSKDGKPIVVDFNASPAFRTSGYGTQPPEQPSVVAGEKGKPEISRTLLRNPWQRLYNDLYLPGQRALEKSRAAGEELPPGVTNFGPPRYATSEDPFNRPKAKPRPGQ